MEKVPPKKVKCTETQIWFDRQRLLLWFFKWGREIGNYAKRDRREKKGGGEGTRSQGRGREVKEESYDEYVCSMICSKAINWSKLMPLTLESEGGMMIKQKNKIDKILKMRKMKEKKELKGKQKPRVFYLLGIAFLAEMWRLPFNHWTVFLFFMSLSPSAHILPSLFLFPLYRLFSLSLFIFSFTLYLYNCPLSSLPPRLFSLNSHCLVFLSFSISPPLDPCLKLYACACAWETHVYECVLNVLMRVTGETDWSVFREAEHQ